MKMSKNIEYINEEIESAYDGAQCLKKIDNRNRMLVKWTQFGMQIIIKKGDKNGI